MRSPSICDWSQCVQGVVLIWKGIFVSEMAHLCQWFSYRLSPPVLGFRRRWWYYMWWKPSNWFFCLMNPLLKFSELQLTSNMTYPVCVKNWNILTYIWMNHWHSLIILASFRQSSSLSLTFAIPWVTSVAKTYPTTFFRVGVIWSYKTDWSADGSVFQKLKHCSNIIVEISTEVCIFQLIYNRNKQIAWARKISRTRITEDWMSKYMNYICLTKICVRKGFSMYSAHEDPHIMILIPYCYPQCQQIDWLCTV